LGVTPIIPEIWAFGQKAALGNSLKKLTNSLLVGCFYMRECGGVFFRGFLGDLLLQSAVGRAKPLITDSFFALQ
jgi:hypothetical protein